MSGMAARFQELIRQVPIPAPWDTLEFVRTVADYRGRPIILSQIDAATLAGTGCGTGSGLWIAREHDDLILYGADTEWHADHIIAHELAHMLLGHGEDAVGDTVGLEDVPLQTLMPSLSMDAIKSVLGRSDYTLDRERDAETFADLVMVEATLPRRRPSAFRSTFFTARHR
jgi:hypothetical protein